MDATYVLPVLARDFDGTTTTILTTEATRFLKLARLRMLKKQLGELRREHDQLQAELFGIQGSGAS
jgi:hypothetical protein